MNIVKLKTLSPNVEENQIFELEQNKLYIIGRKASLKNWNI